MRWLRGAAAWLILAAATGSAASADPRFSKRLFVPNDIVTVRTAPGIESAVAFAPDERIENIAVGDSNIWQVNPNKRANVIFVKPSKRGARTNMTVITDQRTYLFDLVSSSANTPVYMLRFTYPDVPKAPAAETAQARDAMVVAPVVQVPKAAPVAFNFDWRPAGERQLLPTTYFDDGSSTFLRWPKDVPLPAILVRGPNRSEGPVNYTVKDDYIVVEGVPAQLVLRSGKQLATLTLVRRPARAMASKGPPAIELAAGKAGQ